MNCLFCDSPLLFSEDRGSHCDGCDKFAVNPDAIPLDCGGYRKLLDAVKRDEETSAGMHDYRSKLAWIVARARHYAEKTGLAAEDILDAWEDRRDYWYMNYYQECNQPALSDDSVRVFDTLEDLRDSIGGAGFRCPLCGGVSRSPYECDSGNRVDGKPCDWKVYGLFRDLGKGVSVYVKEKLAGERMFMPVAWERGGGPELEADA